MYFMYKINDNNNDMTSGSVAILYIIIIDIYIYIYIYRCRVYDLYSRSGRNCQLVVELGHVTYCVRVYTCIYIYIYIYNNNNNIATLGLVSSPCLDSRYRSL